MQYEPGETASGLHLIASGEVEVVTQEESGEKLVLASLGPGEVVGEVATSETSVERLADLAKREAQGVGIDKKLIFFGQSYYYRGNYGQVMSNQKVGVYLDVKNSEQNHLGMPLPKGTVRVYKADKSGAKQFIGEDHIDHTPRDEKIRVKMGEAFDVVADRKQTDWKSLGSCNSESGWEISVRNHKDTAETVDIFEPVGGDWEITSESHPHVKQDAWTFTYTVKVPAKGDVKVKYRVRIKWC